MAQKKKATRRTPSKETKKKIQPEDRALHILMPFILTLLALFFTLCFIFGEKLGVVRRYLRHMVLHGGHPDGVDVYVDVDAQALL